MPKVSQALKRLPPSTANALGAMGAHLAVARIRRRQSLSDWAGRIGVTVPTLMRMESGDPSVAAGLYASALWLIGRDGELAKIAAPEHDVGALELDVRAAVELGKRRAIAARNARAARNAQVARNAQTAPGAQAASDAQTSVDVNLAREDGGKP